MWVSFGHVYLHFSGSINKLLSVAQCEIWLNPQEFSNFSLFELLKVLEYRLTSLKLHLTSRLGSYQRSPRNFHKSPSLCSHRPKNRTSIHVKKLPIVIESQHEWKHHMRWIIDETIVNSFFMRVCGATRCRLSSHLIIVPLIQSRCENISICLPLSAVLWW